MFSALYGRVVALRNALYDRGLFTAHDLGARTISVGNITTGGTGKTPLAAYIAEILAAHGEKVCILTRGYGRKNPKKRVLVSDGEKVLVDAATGGDEPVELARKLLGKAIIIADPNRIAAGRWAKETFGVTTFILDDGFQHRNVKRDVDVVCIDASDPFGNGKMLPAGRLREPIKNLSRSHIAVFMRAEKETDSQSLRNEIQHAAPNASLFEACRTLKSLRRIEDGSAPNGDETFFVFAGLGNPAAFAAWLTDQKINKVGFQEFHDHHRFAQADIDELHAMAKESQANALLTTVKDAVKISDFKFEIPCFVLEIELTLDDSESFAPLL